MSKVFRYDSIQAEPVETAGASKVKVRWLITKDMGAKNFAMRIFEIESGGCSPLHKHPWEHEVFVLEGEGQLFNGEDATPIKAGDVVCSARQDAPIRQQRKTAAKIHLSNTLH